MESSNRSKTTGLKRDLACPATLIVNVEIQCVACAIAANQLATRGRRFGNWPVNDSAQILRNAIQRLYTGLDRLRTLISDYKNRKWTKTWLIVHGLPIVSNIMTEACAITSGLRRRRNCTSSEPLRFRTGEITLTVKLTGAVKNEGERFSDNLWITGV